MKSVGIIPVRLQSERFPNKLLQPVLGKPILQRVVENALSFDFLDKLVIATEDELPDYMKNYDVEIFPIKEKVWCGSQRSHIYYKQNKSFDNYISIPADEPMLDPNEINKSYHSTVLTYPVYTFYSPFYSKERLNSNQSCKIAGGEKALYFSRNVIPSSKDDKLSIEYKKHIGIFIFRNSIMEKDIWSGYEDSLAQIESLEQNIWIENGVDVGLIKTDHKYCGVDKIEDIENIEKMYESNI